MANTNYLGTNPVLPEADSNELRPVTDNSRRIVGAPVANRHNRELWPHVSEIAARPIPDSPPGLTSWVANPRTERQYVRIDISCEDIDGIRALTDTGFGGGLEIVERTIGARKYFANVDTGFSVYCGATENRVSITLFEVSLCGAFGFFALLRGRLRHAGFPVDCGRFYFEDNGREASHCAKRIAPAQFTTAAGLSLTLETDGDGAYDKTKVYASGGFTRPIAGKLA